MWDLRGIVYALLSVAALFSLLAAQPTSLTPGQEISMSPSMILRLELGAQGEIYTLANRTRTISRLSPLGEIQKAYSFEAPEDGQWPHLLDFHLESSDRFLGLALKENSTGQAEAALFTMEDGGIAWRPRLERSLQAWRLGRDAAGDIYVVGLDSESYRELARGDFAAPAVPVIHRFGRDGSFKGPYLELPAPTSEQFGRRLVDPLSEVCNLAVEGTGRLWFLYMAGEPGQQLSEWERRLFRVALPSGRVMEVALEPPAPGFFPLGIHQRSNGPALLEWGAEDSPFSKILTNPQGRIVRSLEMEGRILALGKDSIFSLVHLGGSTFRLLKIKIPQQSVLE